MTEAAAKRVLVVDDDPSFVTFVCEAIEKLGVLTEVSPNGSDALHRLTQGGWAGVLLDLKLPDIHGVEVLRSLRERGDCVPVVVVSGAASVQAAVEATKLGAVDVLEKPVRLPVLVRMIEQLLTPADPGPRNPVDHLGGIVPPRNDSWHATELVARDLVVVVCAPVDSPTVAHWAAALAVSLPVLRARCDRARLRAKACLDLGRIVRASVRTDSTLPLSEILASHDERTIEALLGRGGLSVADLSALDLRQLLTRQLFVRHEAFIEAFLRNIEQMWPRNLQ